MRRLIDLTRKLISSNLLRRLVLTLIVLSLVPLFAISYFAVDNFQKARDDVLKRSIEDLDRRSFEGLDARTVTLAQAAAAFLRERESDLQVLAALPRTYEAYEAFARSKQGQLWTVIEPTGKNRQQGVEMRFTLPLYREVAFINTAGQEQVKIVNNCEDYPIKCRIVPTSTLVSAKDPAQTLFKSETYFAEALKLKPGEIYVGRMVGFFDPQEAAYAGAQNRGGEPYRGVLRFAAPVFEGEQKVGVVVLSVEWLHFMELTAHIAPANPNYQAEIDPRLADFAYVVDPDGWAISHPRHFNIFGVDDKGQPVSSISEKDKDDFFRPGNLSQMGFLSPMFPELVKKNQAGDATSGTHLVEKVQGRDRALVFATIPYFTGQYNTKAGFGVIVLSTDGERFHKDTEVLSKRFENAISSVNDTVNILTVITLALALLLAVVLASNVAFPILRLTDSAHEIEGGRWEQANIDGISGTKGTDEVSRLARVFASMAQEIRAREAQLRAQVQELKIVIDEVKRQKQVSEIVDTDFFQDLTSKAKLLRQKRRGGIPASDAPAASDAPTASDAPAASNTSPAE
jgi:HAMP domain-containing protein